MTAPDRHHQVHQVHHRLSSSSSSYSSSSSTSYSGSLSVETDRGRRHSSHEYGFNAGINSNLSYDGDFDETSGVAFVIVVFLIFWFIIRRNSKKRQAMRERNIINVQENVRTLRPMSEYLELDPQFDEERIKTMISNLYVQMQNTWQQKDISSLRPYMTDAFFSQMDRQLEAFRQTGRTDHTERIAVLNTGLVGWRQSAGMDYITVSLNSRIVSYILDDRTGKLLSGDMNREKFMEYEIELCRKSGTVTSPETEGTKSATCPHCGAPLKLNASAQCEYCGSVITSVNSEWAICGMRGISQRTA